MVHVLQIGELAGLNREILLAFCGAFIHDMARKHDGYCVQHGAWAAQHKLPQFRELFFSEGVDNSGLRDIGLAVHNHSIHDEIDVLHSSYKTVALLKDADALDRIRISKNALDPDYLRFPESHELVGFAEDLFYATDELRFESFTEILAIAHKIKNKHSD